MKTYVLYHQGCNDGFCAAWVARGVLRGEVEFLPVQYGNPPPPLETKSRVYILDFSYKKKILLEMAEAAETLVVLDHHKTAQEELQGTFPDNIILKFDMEKSGGRLAWEHFYRFANMPSPWLVDYTEDRDLWRFKLMESRAVNAALASYERTFEQWDQLHKLGAPIDTLAREGWAILRYQQQIIDGALAVASEIELDGHKVLTVNTTVCVSEIAGKLAEGRPFGTCFFIRKDGKKVWSLRSTDAGVDVSEVARRHGGGGHRNAAGFEE